MDPSNDGCFVERGQPLCLIGNPNSKKIAMYLDQDWIREVETGTIVAIRFDHAPHLTIEGKSFKYRRRIASKPTRSFDRKSSHAGQE